MTRSALVTGANGLIGSNIARELLRAGYEVRGLVRPGGDRRGLAGIEGDIELVTGDILDATSLVGSADGCDVVFHAAAVFAYWGIDEAELEAVTVEGTANVLVAAAAADVDRVVLTSSSVVCGSSTRPIARDERQELRDPDPPFYYRAKARQEREAFARAEELGIELVAALPTITVGGPDYRLVPSNAIIVNYLNDPWRLTFPGGCNVVGVRDVARGHVLLAERGMAGRRYLLGSENVTWEQFHELIAELAGIRGPLATTSYTQAFLAASAMELWARVSGKPPASTRAQAKTLGRFYWYSHARAAALGYAPQPARQAVDGALDFLLDSPHVANNTRVRARALAIEGPA
jgi:dihydroflavonol-4-reductase